MNLEKKENREEEGGIRWWRWRRWGVSLDLWRNLYGRNRRKEILCEKRKAETYHVDPPRARGCSLILCFLGYLMKY